MDVHCVGRLLSLYETCIPAPLWLLGRTKSNGHLGFTKHVNKVMPVIERTKHFTFTRSVASSNLFCSHI